MKIPLFYLAVFQLFGLTIARAASNLPVSVDTVINSDPTFANQSCGPNSSDDIIYSTFSTLVKLSPSPSYSGKQIIPGTGSAILTPEDHDTPGTGLIGISVTNVSLTSTASPTYNQTVSSGLISLGTSRYVIDPTGYMGTVSGPVFEQAIDLLLSGSYKEIVFSYQGLGGPYYNGNGGAEGPKVYGDLQTIPNVPEPSSCMVVAGVLVFGASLRWLRARRA